MLGRFMHLLDGLWYCFLTYCAPWFSHAPCNCKCNTLSFTHKKNTWLDSYMLLVILQQHVQYTMTDLIDIVKLKTSFPVNTREWEWMVTPCIPAAHSLHVPHLWRMAQFKFVVQAIKTPCATFVDCILPQVGRAQLLLKLLSTPRFLALGKS